ncbi:MAG: tripartite tricarboxylate transporter TctB family protein [Thermodesulfobacteriota bacterium]
MKMKSQKDFFSGLLFMGVGIAFAVGSTTYKVGVADNMGPGYFPLLLGILMALLGIAITVQALVLETREGDRIGRWAWKPLFYVLGANLAFGVLLSGLPGIGLPASGMVAAIYALTFIASLAARKFNYLHVFILATVLSAVSYLAFVMLLKSQIPIWPVLITG